MVIHNIESLKLQIETSHQRVFSLNTNIAYLDD